MKIIKWAVTSFFVILVVLWISYFYLQTNKEKVMQKSSEKDTKPTLVTQLHEKTLPETVTAFCKALYSGADVTAFTTEHGRASVSPILGEKLSNPKVDVRVRVGRIQLFSGDITKENADMIAAVERSITVNGITTVNVQYIRLHLLMKDRWRIDQIVFLTDVPMQ